jgi:hypothetical protein
MSKFTDKEISYMKALGLAFDFNNLSDEDWAWADIEDIVGDKYTFDGFDEDDVITSDGVICEGIIDKIPK